MKWNDEHYLKGWTDAMSKILNYIENEYDINEIRKLCKDEISKSLN